MQIIDTIDCERWKRTLDGYIPVTGGRYVSKKHFQSRPIQRARLCGKMYIWVEGPLVLEGNSQFLEIVCCHFYLFVDCPSL